MALIAPININMLQCYQGKKAVKPPSAMYQFIEQKAALGGRGCRQDG